MKNSPLVIAAAALLWSCEPGQGATDPENSAAEDPVELNLTPDQDSHFQPSFEVGIEAWMSTGEGEWEIEFGSFFFDGKSKLKWEDIDAPVLILNVEAAITPNISVGGSFGVGEIDDGQNTDGDWIGNFQFSESRADTDGDVTLADINIYYHILSAEVSGRPFEMEVFAGYLYYQDDLTDKNGVQTIIDDQAVFEPFDGLNSTYSFTWQMAKLGVRAKSQLSDAFKIQGSFAVLALIDYEGEGFWNLRDDFRSEDPNFVHSADSGTGFDGKISLHFSMTDHTSLQGGYRLIYIQAEDGEDKTYFADGSSESTNLTNVESIRHGAFAAISYIF